jgi:hypothetical protein
VLNRICTPCSIQYCIECTSSDECLTCTSDRFLLSGACLGSCPSGFKSNGTHCTDIAQVSMTSSSSFPVPFTIAAIVVIIACLMSKLQFGNTFIPGAIFAILALLEWGALVCFLILYHIAFFATFSVPFFLALAALVYLYLVNLSALFLQNFSLYNDQPFTEWLKETTNKITVIITNIVATLLNHKFRNILFCKLFTFEFFTAQLESINKFKIINVFSFLSLIHSAAAIAGAALALRSIIVSTQLYYISIDVIIVTTINAAMAYFNVNKEPDFFPDRQSLSKKIYMEDGLLVATGTKLQSALGKNLQDLSHGSLLEGALDEQQNK